MAFQALLFFFLLGAGESAIGPARAKRVSDGFQKREAPAGAVDSGSSVGGAVAPFLILPV